VQKPAISLVAVPGRVQATIEVAQEFERRGFSGVYCPSLAGDGLGLCLAVAQKTTTIRVGTSIAPIYMRHVVDFAQTASFIHEVSGGRFVFGVGVSHAPVHRRYGVTAGKPLEDMRRFVEGLRAVPRLELPPVVLATLRKRMVQLAGEVADGVVWANGARSHMAASLAHLPSEKLGSPDFFVGNMIPTCISDDKAAAAEVMRKTLTGYAMLPNYQNYWIEAGHGDEISAIRQAVAAGQQDKLTSIMSERWLADVTLYGSAAEVREGVEAWYAAGVRTPILVPSSASGGQMQALQELLAAFD
jgi:alkanesulfonate monooxygenase SsuD/methylene tetrahydromethanopterin reductase-like flavin-dependent oxidoreductase (luciferase family)